MSAKVGAQGRSAAPTRAETAAEKISELARRAGSGARLGSRDELRALCGVSVGTLHEALRLLQSTGEIFVRTGPGGGIFAAESSALSGLMRSIHGQVFKEPLYPQSARVLQALRPLIFADAIAAMTPVHATLLAGRVAELETVAHGQELKVLVLASLEVFATIVSIPPPGILRTIAASILRTQMDTVRSISGRIDPEWRTAVDDHVEVASRMARAIVATDREAALAHADDPKFMGLFEEIVHRQATEAQPSAGAKSVPYAPTMTDFTKGDRVSWATSQGRTQGHVVEKKTADFEFADQQFRASSEEPAFIVKSEKTGAEAAHKGSALRKLSPRASD